VRITKESRRVLARAFIGLSLCPAAFGAGSYRLYSGPPRPLNQVAILTRAKGSGCLLLVGIDGKEGPRGGDLGYGSLVRNGFTVEILPGPHEFRFTYYCPSFGSGTAVLSFGKPTISIVAEPGRLYEAKAIESENAWKPEVTEVGPIPAKYKRPTSSCDDFRTGGPGGCLAETAPGSGMGAKSGAGTSGISVTASFPIGGANFSIAGGDVAQIFAAREMLGRCAKDLDLAQASGKREFLARYDKERQQHPELSKLKIMSPEVALPSP